MDSQSIVPVRLHGPSGALGVAPFTRRAALMLCTDPITVVMALAATAVQVFPMLTTYVFRTGQPLPKLARELARESVFGFHLAGLIVVAASLVALVRRYSGRLIGMLRQLRMAGLAGRRMLLAILGIAAVLVLLQPAAPIMAATLIWATPISPEALVHVASLGAIPAALSSFGISMVAIADDRRTASRGLLVVALWIVQWSLLVWGADAARHSFLRSNDPLPGALAAYALFSVTFLAAPWLDRLGRRL